MFWHLTWIVHQWRHLARTFNNIILNCIFIWIAKIMMVTTHFNGFDIFSRLFPVLQFYNIEKKSFFFEENIFKTFFFFYNFWHETCFEHWRLYVLFGWKLTLGSYNAINSSKNEDYISQHIITLSWSWFLNLFSSTTF